MWPYICFPCRSKGRLLLRLSNILLYSGRDVTNYKILRGSWLKLNAEKPGYKGRSVSRKPLMLRYYNLLYCDTQLYSLSCPLAQMGPGPPAQLEYDQYFSLRPFHQPLLVLSKLIKNFSVPVKLVVVF